MDKVRRYDIDWLRVIAVLLLIPFHTMHIFILQPYSVVYIKNAAGCSAFEKITGFIHTFHMPLLFFLAGASAYLSIQVRGIHHFISERFRRLLIPLLTGILLFIPPMTYIYQISIGNNISLWEHYLHFFSSNPGDLSGITGAFTPAHLWFILFLFVFSLAGVPLFKLVNQYSTKNNAVSSPFAKRLGLLFFTIPLAAAAATNVLDDKNPFVYFLIFVLGYIVMSRKEYQEAIKRDKLIYLVLGVILSGITLYFDNNFSLWSAGWLLYEIMRIANNLIWVFAITGYGQKLLNRPSKILSYLSKASFPVYILHLPVNTVVGYFIVKMNIGIGLKLCLIILLTTLFTYALYEILRHIKPVCFLMGIKNEDTCK